MSSLISVERIENKIYLIRSQKVMIDRDLAELYGVKTKVLNQAVRRNILRFPEDFMFQLSKMEFFELVTICDRFKTLKHSSSFPFVFTENGVAMLSSVLKSEKAINVNIQIMRAFTKLRGLLSSHKELLSKLDALQRQTGKNTADIKVIFSAIRKMLASESKPVKKIGFLRD